MNQFYRQLTRKALPTTLLALLLAVACAFCGIGFSAWDTAERQLAAAVCDSRSIYEAAWELYRRENKRWAIRLLGVRAGRLVPAGESQISFFDDADGIKRREQLESAVDRVRARYGDGSINRAFAIKPQREDRHE